MKHNSTYTSFTNLFQSAIILLMLLFASTESSAQDVQELPKSVEVQTSVSSSEMELVSWFMATKHSKTGAGFDSNTMHSQKKQIIKSGMTPNRILTRTFMNKAMNYETTLV